MKYCNNCGQQLADNAAFCTSCGAASTTTAAPAQVSQDTMATTSNSYPVQGAGEMAPPGGMPGVPLAPPIPPSKRRSWLWITAGIVVFLLAACSVVYSMGNFSAPRTTKLAPASTELFLCIKPNMLQVKNFNQLKDVYMSIPEVKDAVEKLQKELRENQDIDYDKDIDPWLGKEAALFMPELDKQDIAVAIAYKDAQKAKDFMAKLEKGKDGEKETYNGVEITNYESDACVALVNDFMIISPEKELIKQTIDRATGKTRNNLESNAEYQRVVGGLPWNKSAFCYMNMQQVMDSSNGGLDALGGMSELKDLSKTLDSFQGLGAAVTLESNGIRGDYILAFDKNGVPEYIKTSAKNKEELQNTLNIMPSDTLGFLHSSNLVKIVQETLKNPGSSSDLAQINRSISEIERATGINIQTDILDILRGDATLAITPAYGDFLGQGNVPVGAVLALGVNDQQTARDKTDKVMDVLERNAVRVDREEVDGNQQYIISEPYGNQAVSMGLGNNLLIMASSPELIQKVLSKHSSNLMQNEDYKKAFEPLDGSWEPALYVNMSKASQIIGDNLSDYEQEQYEKEVKPFLEPLKSISSAYSSWNDSKAVIQSAFFIRIEK